MMEPSVLLPAAAQAGPSREGGADGPLADTAALCFLRRPSDIITRASAMPVGEG